MKPSLKPITLAIIALSIPASPLSADPFAEMDSALGKAGASEPSTQAAFEAYKKAHNERYDAYKEQLLKDFNAYQAIVTEETERYSKTLKTKWDEPKLSTKKTWVSYSSDLNTRNQVDFEQRTLTIETILPAKQSLDPAEIRAKIAKLVKTNQREAFETDAVAQAIEKRSKAKLSTLKTAEVPPRPILAPVITNESEPDSAKVDAAIDALVTSAKRSTEKDHNGQTVATITVALPQPEPKPETEPQPQKATDTSKPRPMASTRLHKLPNGAQALAPHIDTYAKKHELDEALVLAIIETESAFNPMAKSPIPAYGLMQVVPGSAGLDATEFLFGKGKVLSPSYLYASEKNIEIGTAYLHILFNRYLKKIEDPTSRLYCSIAAYNTGSGNVAKAFSGQLRVSSAVDKINALPPQAVYDHLIENLPYEETRAYLRKVVARMKTYSS